MRDWLLTTPLFKWAYRQGGIDSFPLALKDLEETRDYQIDKKAEELANQRLSALLSPVDMSVVVATDSRTRALLIGGVKPDAIKVSNLKAEVEFLYASELWRLLQETPKALAERAMFMEDGTLENQLLKGRAILFMLATQKKICDTLKDAVIPTVDTKTP